VSRHTKPAKAAIGCAIYTRKSSEEGLEQSFNSLDAQREACVAYVKSQCHEGWGLVPTAYDDGGFSGGSLNRPALTRLIEDLKQGWVDIIVVYKVDRLSRSLADFVRLVELFDAHGVSFVSVTQQFNTSTSMGRLTLNVLLSFAQFEREVTGERIRDKIAASKQKGLWMGGVTPLGYEVQDRALVVNRQEAETVNHIFNRYLALGCVRKLKAELDRDGHVSKVRLQEGKQVAGGVSFSRGALYTLLRNPLYIGKIAHKGKRHDGQHAAIVDTALWENVQRRLAENRQHARLRTAAKAPSLLAGLLTDDRGNPMSPTHTAKNKRRYRYYVSQAVLQFRESNAGSVIRVPARPVEEAVVAQIKQLLTSNLELLRTIGTRCLLPSRSTTSTRSSGISRLAARSYACSFRALRSRPFCWLVYRDSIRWLMERTATPMRSAYPCNSSAVGLKPAWPFRPGSPHRPTTAR
jgi:site-specific DNA recombinase